MRKTVLFTLLVLCVGLVSAQSKKGYAEIKFDKTMHDFGKFSEKSPKIAYDFTFTNTGNEPLVIKEAQVSCKNCTQVKFSKDPVQPGKKGTIKVTYDGTGRYPGVFAKTVTVVSNARSQTVRLVVKGEMLAKK